MLWWMDIREELARAIIEGRVATREDLERLKREVAARHRLARVPTDADILAVMGETAPPRARTLLRTKPSRSLSGVTVVGAILSVKTGQPWLGTVLGLMALTCAMVNVIGGFMVTDRMLSMFGSKKKKQPQQ